jgi:hypothetical protein
VIMRNYLWDPPGQIKIELSNHLFDHVDPIGSLSQLRTEILSNSNK